MKDMVFCDVTLCSMLDRCQCIRWTRCHFLQDRGVSCTGRCDQSIWQGGQEPGCYVSGRT